MTKFDSGSSMPFDSASSFFGLARVNSNLTVTIFSPTVDSGYYWCQLEEVSNSGGCLLQPSPAGLVNLSFSNSSNSSNCSTRGGRGIIEVEGRRTTLIFCAESMCPSDRTLQFPVDSLAEDNTTTFPVPCSTSSPGGGGGGGGGDSSVLSYGIIGLLVFITSMLSAAITLLVVVGLSQRRKIRAKSNGMCS